MKNVRGRSVKIYSLLILALITAIVITPSCKDETVNYPSARFVLKGIVLSDTLEQPLENILVIMMEYRVKNDSGNIERILVPVDSAITNIDGVFEVTDSLGIPAEIAYNLAFIDTGKILKASNGRIDTSMVYEFTKLTFTNGDGHWFAGETFKTDTFRLETIKE